MRAFGARSKFGAELRRYLVFIFILFLASLGSDSGLAASMFLICRRPSSLRLNLTPGSPLRSVLICKLPSSFADLDVVLGRTAQVPGGV